MVLDIVLSRLGGLWLARCPRQPEIPRVGLAGRTGIGTGVKWPG